MVWYPLKVNLIEILKGITKNTTINIKELHDPHITITCWYLFLCNYSSFLVNSNLPNKFLKNIFFKDQTQTHFLFRSNYWVCFRVIMNKFIVLRTHMYAFCVLIIRIPAVSLHCKGVITYQVKVTTNSESNEMPEIIYLTDCKSFRDGYLLISKTHVLIFSRAWQIL